MDTSILEVRDITKIYSNGVVANKNVSISFRRGEIHSIVGENGAGKSTLMKIIFGVEAASSGKLILRGEEKNFKSSMDAIKEGIGMVHQHFMLIDAFTVTENIILGSEVTKGLSLDTKTAAKKIQALSDQYGLSVDPMAKISDISVGQQQRVEILKTLYRGADILIFDEPTRGIDVGAKNEIYKLMNRLAEEGKSIIMISSEMTEILRMSDRIVVMCEGRKTGEIDISEASQEIIMNMATREI